MPRSLCRRPGAVSLPGRAVKEAASRSAAMSLEEAFATRYPWEERRMRSRDAMEGPAAFTQKREPRWEAR